MFGAWAGNALLGYTFTKFLTDENGNLTSTVAVVSFLLSLPISGIGVGILFVLLYNQILKSYKNVPLNNLQLNAYIS